MSEKAGDKSLPDFSKQVKESLASTMSNAHAAGMTDAEVDAIIEQTYKEYGNHAVSRVLTKIKRQIGNTIEMKSANAVKGCLVGSRDRFGKPSPIRYLLLKPDKKHIEISNFGHSTIYKDKSEYHIPTPSLVTIRVMPEIDYNTWKFVAIEDITRESLDSDTLISVMTASQIDPKIITQEMAWSQGKPSTPVVIEGIITRIDAEAEFKRDESGKSEVAKYLPVWIASEEGYQPCFSFGLKTKSGGKFIRCHIEHQRYGKPTIFLEELEDLCKRAVEKFGSNPRAQAKYLNEWFGEVPVLIAGVISSYRESTDKSGKGVTNVEIGVAAVVETKDRAVGDTGQKTVQKEPDTPRPPAQKKEEPVKPKPTEPGPLTVKAIAEDIKLWCAAANVDPASLTLDTIRGKALDRYKDVPNTVINVAIEKIQRGEV